MLHIPIKVTQYNQHLNKNQTHISMLHVQNNLSTTSRTIRQIARTAEKKIKTRTGMGVNIVLYPTHQPLRSPEHMLHIIASALHMPASDFTLKSRVRDVVELRFLGAYLLRQYYPGITLKQISILFGGQDHSSIINSIQRAVDMLQTKDEIFLYKYQTTQKAINEWLRKDVLALGSAASA